MERQYKSPDDLIVEQHKEVVYPGAQITSKYNRSNPKFGDPAPTLSTASARDTLVQKTGRKYIIRRLTPVECLRLQGLPDWWVDGANGSDSAIYKMAGNGIAIPCAEDVIGRIANALREEEQ